MFAHVLESLVSLSRSQPGYTLHGVARLCTAGVLTGSDQVCTGNPCAPLTIVPDNGALGTCGAQVNHGSTCSITCNVCCAV